MCKLILILRIKRYGLEHSEIDLNIPPICFSYREDDNNIYIHSDSFVGDIDGFSFPLHALIRHNMNNANYDLVLNEKHVKMFKSNGEITFSLQNNEENRLITFEIIN